MSTLNAFTTLHCAYQEVPDRLTRALGGETATVPLRVPVGDLRLEKDVVLTLRPKPGYPGYVLLDVAWEPKDGGPYPSFSGTLSVQDEGFGWSRIDLDGTYRPPLSVVGAVFDAAVGKRMAEATADELLRHITTLVAAAV
ncbi:MAG TPA: hypothetical protein VMA36_13565 [Candidatus Limnocylindria bacterium]|jgi:hypothetical protein|nr:hypothetical protein [Candidatus Limnocylindria bacterium]